MSQDTNTQQVNTEVQSLEQDINTTSDVVNTPNVTENVNQEAPAEPVWENVEEVQIPSIEEMTTKAVETIDLLLQAHWITPEQIKQFEKEIQEEWKTEPVKEPVSDNSPERVELIKENATLKVRNTDLQAQVEEAQNLISAQWKTIQSLKWNSSVLSDGEKAFVETLRLANDNKENAYYKRNYEIMLKKELEKEWGISLDWIEQQAYMKKSQTWVQPTQPGISREDEVARQKSAEIQRRLATKR